MRLAVVGVGGAGSRIANQLLDVERATGRNLADGNSLLVYATPPTFDGPERVPEERRLVVGDVHRDVDGAGTDGDPDLGREVAMEERNELNRAFDLLEFHEVDGVLVTAGLAGGIGGGAGAVVIDQLKQIADVPVYAVGVLPSDAEGEAAALSAARSLQSVVERADNVVVFDNEAWVDQPVAEGDENATGTGYAAANAALADRIVTLFGAGEYDASTAPETRLDPSDIIRTLETGGVSTIGFAATELPRSGWLPSVLRSVKQRLPGVPDPEDEAEQTDAATINELVRRAAHSALTVPCDIESADRALIVLSGPSSALSRKGFESGRYWLEEEADIVDVKAGDEPHDHTRTLTATVCFSNVTTVPRIDALQERAVGGAAAPAESEPPRSAVNR